ncbi:hypothetical protein KUTeg_020098 [Tegillarca granosa]|uniref:Uncharacterized protein n=1 Tax=Tegillarca granosa TaxID=220873 RepID=A0ABQ9E9M3_TEGGR|nr:hypothetical protein KUTeg_020098 [Tegillarca granosa]
MHDNICDDPFDMSREKYQMPPRKRPPSVQRDMNPLGNPLKKDSVYLMKKQAQELLDGKLNARDVSKDYLDVLNRYSKSDRDSRSP